eukprot:4903553-Amphidinium_carterae.1
MASNISFILFTSLKFTSTPGPADATGSVLSTAPLSALHTLTASVSNLFELFPPSANPPPELLYSGGGGGGGGGGSEQRVL